MVKLTINQASGITGTDAHCHPNTHECVGIINGSSTLSLGRSPKDSEDEGMELDVSEGDVIIMPAGISHCSLDTRDNYRVIGIYPDVSHIFVIKKCLLLTYDLDDW